MMPTNTCCSFALTLTLLGLFNITNGASVSISQFRQTVEKLIHSNPITAEEIKISKFFILILEKYLYNHLINGSKPMNKAENNVVVSMQKLLHKIKSSLYHSTSAGGAKELGIGLNQPTWVLSELMKFKQQKNQQKAFNN